MHQFSQPIFSLFSHSNSALHNLVIELCCELKKSQKNIRLFSKVTHSFVAIEFDAGVPSQHPREGTHNVPHGAQVNSPLTTVSPHVGGQDLRGPTEGRAKTESTGDKEERVDIGGHVETR